MKLQPWMVTITYLPGKDNLMADGLSRQEWQKSMETAPSSSSETGQSDEGGCEGPALTKEGQGGKIELP